LPALSFRLSHESEWLSIPLKTLLVEDSPSDSHKAYVCFTFSQVSLFLV
jgi:hypothetical protein